MQHKKKKMWNSSVIINSLVDETNFMFGKNNRNSFSTSKRQRSGCTIMKNWKKNSTFVYTRNKKQNKNETLQMTDYHVIANHS